ncbi:MAG: chloride channel protein, partial [Streptosporangiaceae bacterium]
MLIPVIGGLVYGPLIYRYAREARGHGVPEVMIAVAEQGGRIRPQVSVVKALASALCIGTGGSVGREGPIVQIGSALASSLGQWVRMPESRMRIMVACGAAGGISATFNAPVTGVFFGVEIILREFSVDALFTVMLSAMIADITAVPFLGDRPFLSGFPAGITGVVVDSRLSPRSTHGAICAGVDDDEHASHGPAGEVYGPHVRPRPGRDRRPQGRELVQAGRAAAPATARSCRSSVRPPCSWLTLAGRPLAQR